MSKTIRLVLIIAVCLLVSGIIISAIGYGLGLAFRDKISGNLESFEEEISGTVTDMDISIAVGRLKIVKGDEFKIGVENFEKDTIEYDVRNGKLTVKETSKKRWFNISTFWNYNYDPILTIYIKDEAVFENVYINVGAGELDANDINTGELTIDCGVGTVSGKNITANGGELSTGAGEIDLKNINFRGLDINGGTGRVALSGKMTGNINVDNGVGEISLLIEGNKSDYYIEAEGGIGEVSINGSRYREHDFDRSAENTITASNGIGKIEISFE